MKAGELFVQLGITGVDKAVGALGSVRDGLNRITSLSTEAKVGILGMFYGLEQLTSASNRVGLGLKNFEKLTGLSSDALQRWQYLMRQGGVSAEETTQNVVSLQKALANIALNKGAPAGITALSNVLGGLDYKKLQDPYYFLAQMREYARRVKSKGGGPAVEAVMNDILGSFQLSPAFIAQIKTSSVDLTKIRPSELYSDKEKGALSKMAVDWANLGNQIEKSVGRLNVQFGPRLIRDIQLLVPQVLNLVKAFANLADQAKLMKGLSKIFEGWTLLFREITTAINTIRSQGVEGVLPSKQTTEFVARDLLGSVLGQPPPPTRIGPSAGTVNNHVEIRTQVNVGEGANAAEIGREVGVRNTDAANKALRQIPKPVY